MVYINSEANRSLPKNQQNFWNYKGSLSAGALTLGRGVWQNVGIAAGSAIFTKGPDISSAGSSAVGAWAEGKFGVYAPGIVNSVTGKEIPGFVYDIGGAYISEQVNDFGKELAKKKEGEEK